MDDAAKIRALIGGAEATVLFADPRDPTKTIVGLRVDRQVCGLANLTEAFDAMVDLAKAASK